jgi:hypothetical protein
MRITVLDFVQDVCFLLIANCISHLSIPRIQKSRSLFFAIFSLRLETLWNTSMTNAHPTNPPLFYVAHPAGGRWFISRFVGCVEREYAP